MAMWNAANQASEEDETNLPQSLDGKERKKGGREMLDMHQGKIKHTPNRAL